MKIHNKKRKRKLEDEPRAVNKLDPTIHYKDYLSLAEKYAKICES